MADVFFQSIREGVNQRLAEQTDGSYAQVYAIAPQVAVSTDVLYQVVREGVNKKLSRQPDGTYAEVIALTQTQGQYQYIPYMFWVVTTAGASQTFTNSNLSLYQQLQDIDISVNGVLLSRQGGFTWNKLSSSVTILRNLNINDLIEIDSKLLPMQMLTVGVRITQDNNTRITQSGDRRITNQLT